MDEAGASRTIYPLNGLLSRSFPLPLEPGDQVEAVTVIRLRLRLVAAHDRHLTLEVSTKDHGEAVYDLLDNVLASEHISKSLLEVVGVTLHLAFREGIYEGGRTLDVGVSIPNGCSLGSDPREETAQALLKRWGIDVSGLTASNPYEPRQPYQRTLPV